MELNNYTCEVCNEDFETTEVLDLEDEDTDVMCDRCSEEFYFEGDDKIETEFDDEDDEDEESEDEEDED